MKELILILALTSLAIAQTPRNVTLTWADAINPQGTTYNIYKCTGTACAPATKINASPIATKAYTDTAVSGGNTYTYAVTAVNGSQESGKSTTAAAVVSPDLAPPTGLTTIVITVTVTLP